MPWYQIIQTTAGQWDGVHDYYYMETTANGRYLYSLVETGTANVVDKLYDVEYDPSDLRWHNDEPTATPEQWDGINTGANKSAFPTASNMETQYWYSPQEYGGSLMFQFNDPYYVAPAAFFDFLYLTVTNNSLAVEMDVTDVSSGWTGTLYNQTTLETITIAETFVETTLNYADLSNGDWVFTATASDGVEYTSNTVNINYTPPPPEPDESQKRIVSTGGDCEGEFDYYYFETTSGGRYLYGLVSSGSTNRRQGDDKWDIEYDPSDGKFNSTANMPIHYWYTNNSDLFFQFENPYYVA